MTDGEQLRVLFVIYAGMQSASAKQAHWAAEQLALRGHEAMFALRGDSGVLSREEIQPQPRLHFSFHRFVGPRLNRSALATVRAFRPTLIHAWNPMVHTIAAARDYCRATGAPVFVHWEDDDWTMRKGVRGRPPHRVIGYQLRRPIGYVLPHFGPAASNAADLRWIVRNAAALDALTPALAREVETRLGRPCSVLLPITPPNAEAGTEERLRAVKIPVALGGSDVVTYTGTIGPSTIQDFTVSLKAIAMLQAAGRKVAFVHAGTIAPRYDVPRLVRESGIDPQTVAVLGYIPFVQVPSLLARSDVLIQPGPPSRFNRLRLPSKMQAYLAAGVPTITFATGFGEMLEDRKEVLKLHTADPAELAERLAEVMDSPELARALGKGARGASKRLFDARRNTDALVAHYRAATTLRRPQLAARERV